jgi:scyllo-inositol 2-dehydrogenase (NADP+)
MRPINTALLAFGLSGRVFHAPFIVLHEGFQLAGAWERNTKMIREIYPQTRSYQSLEEILKDNSIDLVVVNTPTYTHFDYASQALQAGKHVIIEKAVTATFAEAQSLKDLAAKHEKQVAVFHNRRWDSDFLTVKQVLGSNILGEIIDMEIHFDRYKLELSPKKHKEEPNAGAGLLKDLGAHIIDQALYLFGMPQALFADIRITRPGSLVDDWLDILLYYSTLRLRLKAGYLVKEPLPSYILHGTKGSFLKSRADVQEAALIAGITPGNGWGIEPLNEQGIINYNKNGSSERKVIPTLPGNYLEFYNGVYKALAENTVMPVTIDDGIRVMNIIEAAFESSLKKMVVDL